MAEMQEPSEAMSVEIELEDGTVVNCEVITILEVSGKEYIVLLPEGQTGDEQDVAVPQGQQVAGCHVSALAMIADDGAGRLAVIGQVHLDEGETVLIEKLHIA